MSPGIREPYRIAYAEWGEPDNPRVLICVHGLTRNGRDFDALAEALAGDYRVVCPDVVGGTSMGGLIGMFLAALPERPITRMVMNDVGPFLPKAALQRIVAYVGEEPRFPDMDALDAYLRVIYAPFGPFTDEQWQGLVESSARVLDNGDVGLAYDPGIAVPLRAMPVEDIDMWPVWNEVSSPVLVIRGEESDVLLAETAENMTGTGPGARLEVLAGIGHAPTLMSGEQIDLIRDWLSDA
jgi:pimeloyl-ACP methyl ester carboxylesterase